MLLVLALGATACGGSADPAAPASADPAPTTEELPVDAEELAAQAYVAGYPLVVTMRTLQRLGGLVGVNRLFWQTSLAGPESRVIVAPNRDTLYSIAVLDLRAEPVVLTLPAVPDRYHTYQLLDAWTESFAYLGTRATGGRAGSWAIVPPGWDGPVPAGAEVLESPTPVLFLLGRFLVDDEDDVAEVLAIRDRASLVPLSTAMGTPAPPPLPPLGAPAGPAQDVRRDAGFFTELEEALEIAPPTTTHQRALFAAWRERARTDPAALASGAEAGAARIDGAVHRREADGDQWRAELGIGTYGDDTLLRAVVARVGWGANVGEEAVYPVARTDSEGRPLDGVHTYRITFPPGGLPPVEAFWSLSAYGEDMFFAPHPSGRYTVGDRTPGLTPAEDGSLEIVLAHDDPAAGPRWLPVPEGPFVLMLRLYLPGPSILDGSYRYPLVERVQ